MPQFLVGFWCGFVSALIAFCLFYAYRRRREENGAGNVNKSAVPEVQGKLSGVRVLLADGSRLGRTVIKEFLAERNWKIDEAENEQECFRQIKKHKFDLVFLDQNVSGADGDDTLRRLREEGGLDKNVPVIAVGSLARKENEADYMGRGYAACLGKPIQAKRLDEVLSQVFSKDGNLSEPKGFSYEKGLNNFDGNDEAYRETLVLFAELWEERKEQLRQFLEEENMEEYAILIHAVKGDARTLGAEAFGESAYEQELQAKQGDVKAIRNSFERVIQEGDRNAEFFRTTFS